MTNLLRLMRTFVSGRVPTASAVPAGSIATNPVDGRVWLGQGTADGGASAVTEIATGLTQLWLLMEFGVSAFDFGAKSSAGDVQSVDAGSSVTATPLYTIDFGMASS